MPLPHPRPQDIKHRKNEVFLDVVESVNLLVSASGAVLHSDIVGSVQMRVYLTGASSHSHASLFCSGLSISPLALTTVVPPLIVAPRNARAASRPQRQDCL
jgi:hypothetical protein